MSLSTRVLSVLLAVAFGGRPEAIAFSQESQPTKDARVVVDPDSAEKQPEAGRDSATLTEVHSIADYPAPIDAIAFAPDGKNIAIAIRGEHRSAVQITETLTGKEVLAFRAHAKPVTAIVFSRDGKSVLSADGGGWKGGGTIKVWDAQTGKETQSLEAEHGIYSIAVSPDGRTAVSGGGNGELVLWNLSEGRLLLRCEPSRTTVWCVDYAPSGRLIASATGNGGTLMRRVKDDDLVRLWDARSGKLSRELKGHSAAVRSVAFSPDSRYLLTGSEDKTVRLWDVETGKELRQFSGHTGTVSSVAFSPNGTRALSTGSTTEVLLNNFLARALYKGVVIRVTDTLTGETVEYGIRDDGTVRLWDVQSGEQMGLFRCEEAVEAVRISPDGTLAAVAGREKVVRILGLRTQEQP